MAGTDGSASDRRRALLSELQQAQLEVISHVALAGRDDSDPGVLEWDAQATLSMWPFPDGTRRWDEDPGLALTTVPLNDHAGGHNVVIFRARGLVIDLGTVDDVGAALDARSADYAEFTVLFGHERTRYGTLQLSSDLEDRLTGAGGHQVVIIDRAEIAAAWRGLGGTGRLLVSRVVAWIAAAPCVVALYPFPTDLDEEARHDPAVLQPALARIRRTWASIGFSPFTDDVWIMDPHRAEHEKARAAIERRLKLGIRQ
jgi:hypothetical protein